MSGRCGLGVIALTIFAVLVIGCQTDFKDGSQDAADQQYMIDIRYQSYYDMTDIVDVLSKYEEVPDFDTAHPDKFFIDEDLWLFGFSGADVHGNQTKERIVKDYYPDEPLRYVAHEDAVGREWQSIADNEPVVKAFLRKNAEPVFMVRKNRQIIRTNHPETPSGWEAEHWYERQLRKRR